MGVQSAKKHLIPWKELHKKYLLFYYIGINIKLCEKKILNNDIE